MRHKDKDENQKSPEQEALERQVDAMMDPKRPDDGAGDQPAASSDAEPATASGPKPSNTKSDAGAADTASMPADAKTAPQLSAELRKELGINEADMKPISISKLDEITHRIAVKDADASEHESADPPEQKGTAANDDKNDDGKKGVKASKEKAVEPESDPTAESADLDDARTDEAVDDIVRHEGDVMLALADATAAERSRQMEDKSSDRSGHHVLSTIFWGLIFLIVVAAVLMVVLFVTGGNVTGLHFGSS